MGSKKHQEGANVAENRTDEQYRQSRYQPAPSKRELRQMCIERDRDEGQLCFPEREPEQSASAMLL